MKSVIFYLYFLRARPRCREWGKEKVRKVMDREEKTTDFTDLTDAAALARVTIFEVAERPWGWLTTSAEVDDQIYVGSREWRQQLNSKSS